jgi:hypothetical protein
VAGTNPAITAKAPGLVGSSRPFANGGLSPALDKSVGLGKARMAVRDAGCSPCDAAHELNVRFDPILNHAIAGRTLMSNSNPATLRDVFSAVVIAAAMFVAAIVGSLPAQAAGACALIPNDKTPSEKILQCGGAEGLTVRAAPGTRYRTLYTKGDPVPAAIRLDDGALLIEFQRSLWRQDFQILTPLAIAAVRGTKWAVEVTRARTSVLVLSDAVGVTNRRLNQYVILTEGEGVDITPADTSTVQKTWGAARVRALLARFGE